MQKDFANLSNKELDQVHIVFKQYLIQINLRNKVTYLEIVEQLNIQVMFLE